MLEIYKHIRFFWFKKSIDKFFDSLKNCTTRRFVKN